ncbi:tail tubular protein B [Synechococcus phage S-CBP1]|uniref:Tail tubular protein B n=1 Tax=Synechococcus phage S-CBP1 TaxID=1273711 RepID=A0A096VKF7_9CAUD|nr:tail tubular protein B [Synechococcus phage S-CBP1]AGK86538.1 tail tubular protein B [Synechococcus phage S-CBP1]
MTAVSQRIPNFLGGVSQQADEKLFPGQVKDALNCYPDTTLGMIKRPGGKFLSKLAGVTAQSKDTDAWLTVFRDDNTKYIVSITKSTGIVRVWDIATGVEQTVTDTAGVRSYLTASDYRSLKWLTINDFTYLLNTEKVVATQAAPAWTAKKTATIVVSSVEYDTKYKVTIGSTTYTYTSRTNYVTGTPPPQVLPLELSEIVNGISGVIPAGSYATKEIIDNTIYLTFSSGTDVKGEAGPDGKYIRVIQDSVDTFNRLPEQAKHDQVVKIANTSADKDDFYLKFVAENGTSGKGYWEETRAPNVSPGLDATTMPVALLRSANGTFQVAPLDGSVTINSLAIQWEPRLVGDDESNEHPSFVGQTIQDIFLFNNRLGFLTADNVSMSQAGDYYNFYHKTATTQVISDPIDLSCASIRPALLTAVVPIAQGLLLFSESQQFLMEAENGAWTPVNVTIRTISNYECDRHITPADLGSTVMFVSRNQSWARTFEIFTRGQREAPTVTEASKIVPEWIPNSITTAVGSAQNGLWVGSSRSLPDIYMFRYYEEGDERKMASWVRWRLHSNVIFAAIQEDVLYVITSGTEGYNVLSHKLVLSPSTGGLTNYFGNTVDPYMDAWFEITTTPTVVNGSTKVYIPSHFDTAKTMQYVVGLLKVNPTNLRESGLTNIVTVQSDGGGSYFLIPGDVTANYIYLGYQYQMELTLPRYNYSVGEQGYDFTGYTTTARMKFYTGLGGAVNFNLKDNTRAEWTDVSGIRIADVYPADTSPFRDSFIYKVPVYQRPDNYTMKVQSNNPFPVSLVAMQWEGQYSPGFYRKA